MVRRRPPNIPQFDPSQMPVGWYLMKADDNLVQYWDGRAFVTSSPKMGQSYPLFNPGAANVSGNRSPTKLSYEEKPWARDKNGKAIPKTTVIIASIFTGIIVLPVVVIFISVVANIGKAPTYYESAADKFCSKSPTIADCTAKVESEYLSEFHFFQPEADTVPDADILAAGYATCNSITNGAGFRLVMDALEGDVKSKAANDLAFDILYTSVKNLCPQHEKAFDEWIEG